MTGRTEFSVAEFYDDDSYVFVDRWLNAGDALRTAAMRAIGPNATAGKTIKVIVTDGGDNTVFQWEYGKGITFPKVKGAAVTVVERLRKGIIDDTEMTVTAAAKRLGIGRPALSNVLNGKASLSPELALKVQLKFGLDARKLLIDQLDETLDVLRKDK